MSRRPARTSKPSPSFAESIALVEAGVEDPSLADRVAAMLPPGARCLVVEDSAHVYDTTFRSLTTFARFVPPGGYFVVEDGCVDVEEMRLSDDWPRGVLPALHDWLRTPQGQGVHLKPGVGALRDLLSSGGISAPDRLAPGTGPPPAL